MQEPVHMKVHESSDEDDDEGFMMEEDTQQ